jgi:hypothetical protein
MNRKHGIAVAVTSAVALWGGCQGLAVADIGTGGKTRGGAKGNSLGAGVSETKVKIARSGGSGTRELTPADAKWTPPPCWYEPMAPPKQFKESVKRLKGSGGLALVNTYIRWSDELFDQYYKGKSPDGQEYSKYGDYNISQQGKGMWYRGVLNPNAEKGKEDYERGCQELIHWVPNGSKPRYPESISPKILAGYAYSEVKIPGTTVSLNPNGKQTVNLPTWVWLDKTKFKPVKVTASLPGTGLWATTTAKPVGLHIEPGTKDADVSPASGDCPIGDDGRIGSPYVKGSGKKSPPCGVTYLRSTENTGPHQLKATLTWQISWKGSGGTGGNLPNGTFDSAVEINVQETQAVNR